MNKRKNFIKTTSKETAEELKKCGFRLVSEGGNYWVFLNNTSLNFDENANSKQVVYTDILSV